MVDCISFLVLNDHDFASSFLCGWTMKQDPDFGCSNIYLVHSPVHRAVELCNKRLEENTNHDGNDEDYWDETILQDDPATIAQTNDDSQISNATWFFSIVCNDTWKAPILYFNVDLHGSPCPRSTMVELLTKFSHYNRVEDAWEFLSHEEHPTTRIPSFFLHPCRTMERLETLTIVSGLEQKEASPSSSGPSFLLLSWMALILPSVGYPIPSKAYQKVMQQLTKVEETQK